MEAACAAGNKEARQALCDASATPGTSLLLLVQNRDLPTALAHIPYVASYGAEAINASDASGAWGLRAHVYVCSWIVRECFPLRATLRCTWPKSYHFIYPF